jgi:chromosome segregation ATPase
MNDDDFFDLLYQQFTKTTGAESRYWMPEPFDESSGRNRIYAVAEDQSRKLIASGLKTEDADFITAIHGCLPDLIRKLQDSLDEAGRLDREKDELIGQVAELERGADEMAATIFSYAERIKGLEDGMAEADSYVEFLSAEIRQMEKEWDDG